MLHIGNAYCLQLGIILLMWVGLLKIAWSELRALRRESVATEGTLASGSGGELRKYWDFGVKSIGGRRAAVNGSRAENEGRQGLRIRSAENWNGVGVS